MDKVQQSMLQSAIVEHRVIVNRAGRTNPKEIARLVGWDETFYYFDWYDDSASVGRGTGRVPREDFDATNGGSLLLEKGLVKAKGGQVRNWQVVE
ncbi:MAG: hypothetical protein AAGC74_14125 [Verrucomicrobiota bacterium]